MTRTFLTMVACAAIGAAAGCASECADLAGRIDDCFATLDCSERAAGPDRDACNEALMTHTSSGSVFSGDECVDGNERFAQDCKDRVTPETNCACTF